MSPQSPSSVSSTLSFPTSTSVVDEVINISCPLRSRYQQAPPGLKRCLKLSMIDGIQRVFGTEYRPIKALEVCAPSDLKEVPGSSILKALSTLRKQGFSSLPHYYLRAGSTLLARVAFHFADPCYGGLAAAYGPQFQAYSIMPSNSDQIHHGTAPVRIPLPTDLTEEPIYVNSKQYHAILRRRECRAKLEAHNRLIKAPKVSVRLRFRFLSGRNMQDYTADKGGGVNHRRLSVLM